MKKARRARWHEKKMIKKKKKKGGGSTPSLRGSIVHDILMMLPARSVARFRAVSKSWHALTTDPSFILSHAVRHGGAPNRTTIALSRTLWGKSSPIDLFTVTATGHVDVASRMRISWPNPGEGYCLPFSSCHGMLCTFGNSTKSFYICNILSREWIAVVPGPSFAEYAILLSFYFHASTGEYRLLAFFLVKSGMSKLGCFKVEAKLAVITVGTNTWRYLNSSECSYDLKFSNKRCITLNGKVHWVSRKYDSIGFFDTESEEFQKLSLPNTSRQFGNDVVEIEGRLGLCQVMTETTMCIWELKDYTQEGKWIKRHTISFQGIKKAPNMFLLHPFQYMITLGSDQQLLRCRTETAESDTMFLYDLKRKELKETLLCLRGYSFTPFSENTLISSKFFNKQEHELNALRSM